MDGGRVDLELAREFFAKAKSDMESAEIPLKNGKYEDASYHFQQASEKAVKALLIIHRKFESTHIVSPIFEKIGASEKLSENLTVALKDLEKHWLITRYPMRSGKEIWSPVEQYTKANAEDALEKAKFVLETIGKTLKEKYNIVC